MVEWIGYGWISGSISGPNTFFADLTIEVPRGDVVAAAAVTAFSVGVHQHEPGSVAVYIREFARFKSATQIEVVNVTPDPTNNVMGIADCAFVRFRMTVFQARAVSRGLVYRFAPIPAEPKKKAASKKKSAPKFSVKDFDVRIGDRLVGAHRVMALARGSRLPLDSLLRRANQEAARFLGFRPREIQAVRARKRRTPSGTASERPGIF